MTILEPSVIRLVGVILALIPLLARTPHPPVGAHILESKIRRDILDVLDRRPSASLTQLRSEVGVAWGTVFHHVHKLKRAGLVDIIHAGRRRVVVIANRGFDHEVLRGRAFVSGESARAVAEVIAAHPGSRVGDIAKMTGFSTRVVHYHVSRLRLLRLVVSRGASNHSGLRASPMLDRLLSEQDDERSSKPRDSEAAHDG